MKKYSGLKKAIEPNIGINSQDRAVSTDILNTILANEWVLLAKTLNYHWNLVGPQFHDYHLLFNDQYHKIFEKIDDIAERARSIGGIALGALIEFAKQSTLKEDTGDIPAPRVMVENLLHDHEAHIKALREGVNVTAVDNRDMGTSNLLTEVLEMHEKMAWMLRSLLDTYEK